MDLIGQSVGRYHIVEQLGEGGMATVYKAYDTRLEVDVALKVIRTEQFAPSVLERVLRRFEREAKVLAKLTHPNIVKVTDYGEYEGRPYLVMEYLPGGTLKTRLGERGGKPFSCEEAVRLLLPIARALHFAHEQGFIHRDVKPSNILITASGEPMLSDFGIAKILESEETTLTGTGVGIGTPEYMAPEQGLGRPVDARADVYALGVVFYELVTGRRPYEADTPMAVVLKQATEPLPRPGSFVPGLPEEVEKFLFKALAKAPEDRFPDMGAMAAAMERLPSFFTPPGEWGEGKTVPQAAGEEAVLQGAPPAVPPAAVERPVPARPAKRRRWPWAVAVVGLALLAVLAWVLSLVLGPSVKIVAVIQSPAMATPALLPATFTPYPTYIPRMTSTPYPTYTPRPTVTPTPMPQAQVTSQAANLRAGPGTEYAIIGRLSRGDTVKVLAWVQNRRGENWLLVQTGGGERAWLSADLTEVNVAMAALPTAATIPPTPTPVPYRIAFHTDRDGQGEIYVMNADGSGQTNLTKSSAWEWWPAWSPDGKKISFVSCQKDNCEVYVMNADGSGRTNLTNHPAWEGNHAWSPDGRKIAFQSERDGNSEIYVMNADGSGQTRLTNNRAYDGVPAWSPDGRKITFCSDRDGNFEIYVISADGSEVIRLTNNPASDVEAVWSPDGRKIAFVSSRDGNEEIYVMNADGSEVTRLTNNPAKDVHPIWSPDGRKIAFQSERDGNSEIYVMNADGSGQTRLTNNRAYDGEPAWSPR